MPREIRHRTRKEKKQKGIIVAANRARWPLLLALHANIKSFFVFLRVKIISHWWLVNQSVRLPGIRASASSRVNAATQLFASKSNRVAGS